jgi:hypothetical protein
MALLSGRTHPRVRLILYGRPAVQRIPRGIIIDCRVSEEFPRARGRGADDSASWTRRVAPEFTENRVHGGAG